MKIRAITTGISLQSAKEQEKIQEAAKFNQKAQEFFQTQGYEVQTIRIATNSWEEYLPGLSTAEIISEIQAIEQLCQTLNINFLSIGHATKSENIAIIPDINQNTSIIYCSSKIGDWKNGMSLENITQSAKTIKRISQETENGFGNFRYCAWANCKAGIPFFPASYHKGKISFAIGLECSDLVMEAFSNASNLTAAEENFQAILQSEISKVAAIAEEISEKFAIKFFGIDTSIAPSLDKEQSLAFAYEKIMNGSKFGNPGTLSISGMLTRTVKNISIQKCGYSGLMLPVCEDIGLATRANENTYNITDLLLYSAVCGCGLDTVPIPGDVTVEKITAILTDMATLAIKLNKPLSARLFPIPNKKAGEMTAFNSPYLVDCKIFDC